MIVKQKSNISKVLQMIKQKLIVDINASRVLPEPLDFVWIQKDKMDSLVIWTDE